MRPFGLSSPCAIWCETVDSNHAEREARALPQTLRAAALNGAVPKSRIEAALETLSGKMPAKLKRRKTLSWVFVSEAACIGLPFRLCRWYHNSTDADNK